MVHRSPTQVTDDMDVFPRLTAKDVDSMPMALKVAVASIEGPEGVERCRTLVREGVLRALPESRHPWLLPRESYALQLGPDAASRMTRRARQALVWLLWFYDFKWVTWAHGGFVTHVHFGYAPAYGSNRRSVAGYARMRLGADGMLRYTVAGSLRSRPVNAIEFPCDLAGNVYIRVR